MTLIPGFGIDKLLFGMKRPEVEAIYGPASYEYKDEDDNHVLLYNEHRLRLTFYAEEEHRLGYIISSLSALSIEGLQPMGRPLTEVLDALKVKGFTKWAAERIDSCENYVNEANWLILQSEFGYVIKVELGALIDEKNDVFIWRTK